jgi:hypothetical protein
MTIQEVKRKLSAILGADVKEYSRLMGTQLIVEEAKITKRYTNFWNLFLEGRTS